MVRHPDLVRLGPPTLPEYEPDRVPHQDQHLRGFCGRREELLGAGTSRALAAGADFHPPFWLFGTILVAPVVWTSLQWASYSVEQGGEIKNANVFRNQVFILVGSLVATAGLLVLMALAMQKGIGTEGIITASSGFWLGNGKGLIAGTFLFPNMMALGLTSSPIIVALIGLGFILNSFQIVCNCYIGCTRIMVAQGLDGLLPDWFSRVNAKWKTPVNAHVIYFLAAVPVIFAFNKIADWSTKWALGITFANGVVFMFSALAAALLPYRAKALYEASPGAQYRIGGVPWVSVLGFVGFATATFMVGSFLVVPELGLAYSNGAFPYYVVAGTAAFGLIVYLIMRSVRASKGIKVEYAFREIPPE